MDLLFYLHASVAVLAMGMAMFTGHAIHALLYAVFSLLAMAVSMYLLMAPLAAALEVIVYAGAIMVLFVVAVMLLQTPATSGGSTVYHKGRTILALLAFAVFWGELAFALSNGLPKGIMGEQSIKDIAIALFGTYGLLLEVVSFVLLAGLVASIFVGQSFMNHGTKRARSTL